MDHKYKLNITKIASLVSHMLIYGKMMFENYPLQKVAYMLLPYLLYHM